jgi:hypothetical protein
MILKQIANNSSSNKQYKMDMGIHLSDDLAKNSMLNLESNIIEFKDRNILSSAQLLLHGVKLDMSFNNLHINDKLMPSSEPFVASASKISLRNNLSDVIRLNINNKCLCACDCRYRDGYDYMCLAPSYGKKGIISESGEIDFRYITYCRHFASCPLTGTSCQLHNDNISNNSNNVNHNKKRKQSKSCCDNLCTLE